MRLNILVCEDDRLEQKRLLRLIEKCDYDVSVRVCANAEELLGAFIPGKYDLFISDILLDDGMTGVEVTKNIREKDANIPVVFTTSSVDYALEGYRLGVLKYIEKPVEIQAIEDTLKMVSDFKRSGAKIKVDGEKVLENVLISDISFVEQNGHTTIFHLKDGSTVSHRLKMDDVAAQLEEEYYFRCHKSYIVNLNCVKVFNKELLLFELEDGSCAYIRREHLKEAGLLYEKYFR